IPTTTGAAQATAEVLPVLSGKFDGLAIRIPLALVSLSDVTALLGKKATVESVNKAFVKASRTARWKGILDTTIEPLVSSDFIADSHSAIVDLSMTRVVGEDLVKVIAWYDNEWGYANRLMELAILSASGFSKK
ncbi:type I glyceraldehyde-3-phosphate dehydrogenase, partial [Patescibacteria group bacterium]|nr:type I glyceraldehyde-3-phosphate dehydrogenase [Patescibacteria group bacterium]